MAISKILKKAKPKAGPKVKPKKRISPKELKKEVDKLKTGKFSDAEANRLIKKYDDNVRDFIMNEAMRDLKAKGGKVRPKPGDKRPPKRILPKRPIKPGDRRPKPLPRPLKPKLPNPGGRFQPKPRPGERGNPGGRFQPKPRPKPGDRMVLPPRPRKKPTPKIPRSIKELTPEQRRRIMKLVKKVRGGRRPKPAPRPRPLKPRNPTRSGFLGIKRPRRR